MRTETGPGGPPARAGAGRGRGDRRGRRGAGHAPGDRGPRGRAALGATTYYFPTLGDLVAAGLQEVVTGCEALLEDWAAALATADDVPAEIAHRAAAWVAADPATARLEYELYLAASRDPQLLPLARSWLDGARELFGPYAGASAGALVALLDGVMLQAVVTGEPVDGPALAAAVRALLR